MPLGMDDLLDREPITLPRYCLIKEPGEEAEPSWTRSRHLNRAASELLGRSKRSRCFGLFA
jgi:hypothetical protein